MDLNDILLMWENDNNLDKSNLIDEVIRIKKLHPKYVSLLTKTKISLVKKEEILNKLYLEKWKYYLDNMTDKVLTPKERKDSPKGKLTKPETDTYISGDPEYLKIYSLVKMLKVQKETIEDILKEISNISYYLNNLTNLFKYADGN